MKAAVTCILLALAAPGPARAATGPADPVDAALLQQAVDDELERLPASGPLQVSMLAEGMVTLTYTRPDGEVLSRTVHLPARRDDAVETVTLLAVNMVRDQTSDMLADLILTTAPPPRTVWIGGGLVPPLSTDLFYREPVVYRIGLHALVGSSRGFKGVSLAGVADIEGDVAQGVQIGGAAALALGDLEGVQLGGATSVTLGHLRGVQIAPINIARSITGLQLGTINLAGHVHGLQLGVLNYSNTPEGASLGLINIVRHGITEVEGWGESMGTVGFLLRHGRGRLYNTYGVQSAVEPGGTYVVLTGLGLGTRLARARRADLDLEVLGWSVQGAGVDADLSLLSQLRLAATFRLGAHVSLTGGATASVYVADNNEDGEALRPTLDWKWTQDTTTVRIWPTLFAGVRID